MKKIILVIGFLITGSDLMAQGVQYTTGVASSTTPIVVATPISSTAKIDFDAMVTNPSATPGIMIITSGGITVAKHTIGANAGGFISNGWRYPAPIYNNTVKITDVNNVGLEYDFKFWNNLSRNLRP